MSHTQLTLATNYDVNNMIFSVPQENKIPQSTFTYKRINISTKNADGSIGDLVIRTPPLFSFGVQESKSLNEPKVTNGYNLPLCLWNRAGPSDEEKAWTDTFNNICTRAKEHLIENRVDIGKWDLEMADLKTFNPLYWKRDKKSGQVEPGTGPTLYPKLISTKRDGVERIMSLFYDKETNDEINPLDILGKYCTVTAAIKIESVFIGSKFSLQVKLWEVEISLQSGGVQRLLRSAAPARPVRAVQEEKVPVVAAVEEYYSDASDFASEAEPEFAPQPSPPRKRVVGKKGGK